MEHASKNEQEKDERRWSLAKKRAGFKRALAYYFVINAFLWLIWLLTGAKLGNYGIPWPAWATAGWGVGMIFYYFRAYRFPEENATQKEYDKLKQQEKL